MESGHQQGMSGAQCLTSVPSSRVRPVHGKSQSSREERVSLTLQMGKGDGYKHSRYTVRICVQINPLQSWYIIDPTQIVRKQFRGCLQLFQSLIWRHSVLATGGAREDAVHTSGKAWLITLCPLSESCCEFACVLLFPPPPLLIQYGAPGHGKVPAPFTGCLPFSIKTLKILTDTPRGWYPRQLQIHPCPK